LKYSYKDIRSPRKLEILENLDKKMTAKEIADALGVPYPHVTKYLLHYHRQGLVARSKDLDTKQIFWQVTDRGQNRVNYFKNKKFKNF